MNATRYHEYAPVNQICILCHGRPSKSVGIINDLVVSFVLKAHPCLNTDDKGGLMDAEAISITFHIEQALSCVHMWQQTWLVSNTSHTGPRPVAC